MGAGNYFLTTLMLLITLLGSILLIFEFHRFMFIGHFILFLVLFGIAAISLIGVYNDANWGFTGLGIFFGILLFDLLVIYYFRRVVDTVFFTTTLVSALGFISSLVSIKDNELIAMPPPPEPPEKERKKEAKVFTNFSPGKFVASQTGTSYHAPTCDWAKKIKANKRVWLKNKEEAKKKGYKMHSCLKT